MFKNYLKIAFRFFSKNELFTFINISGLTIGITAFLLITQYVNFEKSYDNYHVNIDDLYRVTLTTDLGGNGFETSATNHPAVATALKKDFPEVENYARLVDKSVVWVNNFLLSYRNTIGDIVKVSTNDDRLLIGESSMLELFNIPLVIGDTRTALSEPMTIILSSSLARRFFGDENPIGKIITINNDDLVKVTGVFEDIPQNSHLDFDMLFSFETLNEYTKTTWLWPEFYNYIQLKPGTDPKQIEKKLPFFVEKYLTDIMEEHGFEAKMTLQPVKDIHLKSHLRRELSANNDESTLNFLTIIALFVIAIALMNFINLSTAKSLERAKEVGIRKVVGAQRNSLITQFLCESLIINLLAICLSIVLVNLLIVPFNQLIGFKVLSFDMWSQSGIWATMVLVFLTGGLLAGIYPAFVLSGFRPIQVLKGKFHQSSKGSIFRKALVVTQFAVSIALVSGTFVVYNQFSFMQNQDLGFNKDHSLVINAPIYKDSTTGNKVEAFKRELLKNPNINSSSFTNSVPGKTIITVNNIRKEKDEKTTSVGASYLYADHDFVQTYKVDLLAGRDFRYEDKTSYYNNDAFENPPLHKVILNESAAKKIGFSNVEAAVNQKVIFKEGPIDRKAEVIGVIKDYHHESLKSDFNGMVFIYMDDYFATYLTSNIDGRNIKSTVASIETTFNKFFPNDHFNYFFLDEYFNRQYEADMKFGVICLLFSILAIIIAALGLFGLGSHMAIQKVKEIGLRKVLGATTLQAIILIPKKLLSLILISGFLSIPVVYFVLKRWLENYAFNVEMDVWMFLLPLFIVTIVALLAISSQAVKTAFINPAISLRDE
ncbi:ABC transporter permease [Maribacter sp. 2210JD10-5]|uniref:ABC transporter permease n=1 Tax=Maribacter sp. 2210JD10-5 TaxID=3386272 RepID=UPI0039BC5AB0